MGNKVKRFPEVPNCLVRIKQSCDRSCHRSIKSGPVIGRMVQCLPRTVLGLGLPDGHLLKNEIMKEGPEGFDFFIGPCGVDAVA